MKIKGVKMNTVYKWEKSDNNITYFPYNSFWKPTSYF